MSRTLKDFTAEQIAQAKTYMTNELGPVSEASYDGILLQVLQVHHPLGYPTDVCADWSMPEDAVRRAALSSIHLDRDVPMFGGVPMEKAGQDFSGVSSGRKSMLTSHVVTQPEDWWERLTNVHRVADAVEKGELKLEDESIPGACLRNDRLIRDFIAK